MSTTTSKATSMADLMAKHQPTFTNVRKGEMVKGTITKITPSEILLDINAKTEATVMEKEKRLMRAMVAMLKVGDTVTAQVLNPESDTGDTVVSLRRFMDDKVWEHFAQVQKNHEKMDVMIKSATKGGYLVETKQGIDGFLPNSHVAVKQDTQSLVGSTVSVMIAELNKETRKLIVSQKPVLGQADFDDLVKGIKSGQKIEALVSHITAFGVFVSVPVKAKKEETFLDGLIHISEVSWEKVTDLSGMFEVGQPIEAVVKGIDKTNKRIDLSIKQLTADPFEELLKKYTADTKVSGVVSEVTSQGITIDLDEEGVEGFIRKEKVPANTTYTVGQKLSLTVTDVDKKKHRVNLAPVLLDKPLFYR